LKDIGAIVHLKLDENTNQNKVVINIYNSEDAKLEEQK
jgi:hypothetical protein